MAGIENFRIRDEEIQKAADALFLDRRLWFSCDFHGQSLRDLSKREGPASSAKALPHADKH